MQTGVCYRNMIFESGNGKNARTERVPTEAENCYEVC